MTIHSFLYAVFYCVNINHVLFTSGPNWTAVTSPWPSGAAVKVLLSRGRSWVRISAGAFFFFFFFFFFIISSSFHIQTSFHCSFLLLFFIAPAYSRVRYRSPNFRPSVRSSVRPSTFTSKFGFLYISDG